MLLPHMSFVTKSPVKDPEHFKSVHECAGKSTAKSAVRKSLEGVLGLVFLGLIKAPLGNRT